MVTVVITYSRSHPWRSDVPFDGLCLPVQPVFPGFVPLQGFCRLRVLRYSLLGNPHENWHGNGNHANRTAINNQGLSKSEKGYAYSSSCRIHIGPSLSYIKGLQYTYTLHKKS